MQRRDYFINLLLVLLATVLLAICVGSIAREMQGSNFRQRTEHASSE